jgi:hypothetical protein
MPGSQATADSLWEQINNISADSPARNTRGQTAATARGSQRSVVAETQIESQLVFPETQYSVVADTQDPNGGCQSAVASQQQQGQVINQRPSAVASQQQQVTQINQRPSAVASQQQQVTQINQRPSPASQQQQVTLINQHQRAKSMWTDKANSCSYQFCPGLHVRRSIVCDVCKAEVHPSCAELVVQGQQATVGHYFCSPQCICYFGDAGVNNDVIRRQRELLAGNTKADLCLLAITLGIKVSMRVPGQGSRDLPKDTIICKIIEKKYVDAHTSAANTTPTIDAENVTIHDNFRLINVMFLDEIMEASNQCGNLATRNELDTAQVGANSPFWLTVTSNFNSIIQDGDPNAEGVDFFG